MYNNRLQAGLQECNLHTSHFTYTHHLIKYPGTLDLDLVHGGSDMFTVWDTVVRKETVGFQLGSGTSCFHYISTLLHLINTLFFWAIRPLVFDRRIVRQTHRLTNKQTVWLGPASSVLDSLTNLHYTICLISSCLKQVSARQFDLTTGSSGVVIRG